MRTFLKIVLSLVVEVLCIAAGERAVAGGITYVFAPHDGTSDGSPISTMLLLAGGAVGMFLGAILGGVIILFGWSQQSHNLRKPD